MSNHPKTTPLFRELEHPEEIPLSALGPICEPIEAIQIQAPAAIAMHSIPDVAGLHEQAARISAVMTLFASEDASDAIELADWYLTEILRISASGLDSPQLLAADKLRLWSLGNWKEHSVDVLTVAKSGPYFCISRTTLWRKVKIRVLPGPVSVAGLSRWRRSELLSFLDEASMSAVTA